jgi:aminoglycoside phosphotransferase (APT) family kinase protein
VPERLIGAGRNADVYDAGDGRVLRRYRDQRPAAWVAREAEVMIRARAHGAPVPEVFEVTGSDIVMERASGPTMLDMLSRRPWTVLAQARLLAWLHDVVHAVPAPDWLPAPFGDGAQVLLHRDLHPQNVILTADGPRIIDWEGAARGPAAADVAMTWVIVRFSNVPETGLSAATVRAMQALFARSFLRAAGSLDQEWRAAAIEHRLTDTNLLPPERARLERLRVAEQVTEG